MTDKDDSHDKMLSNRILKIWNRCGNKRFYQFWHAFWMEIFHRLHDRVYTINRVNLAKDWSKMTDQAYCQADSHFSQVRDPQTACPRFSKFLFGLWIPEPNITIEYGKLNFLLDNFQ